MKLSQGKIDISIIYLSIGSGHQMAAEALSNTLKKFLPASTIKLVDPFAGIIDPAILEKIQSASITLTPEIYNSLWQRGMRGNFFERLADLDLLQDMFLKEINLANHNIVVATHVVPCTIAAAIKQNTAAIQKVYGVVTDFGLHSFWPLSGVDGYFVGHEEIRSTFGYRGADTGRIHVTGIPLRGEFAALRSRTAAAPNERTRPLKVMFLAGGLRSGGYVEVQQDLFDVLESLETIPPHQLTVTIILGKLTKLHKKLRNYIQNSNLCLNIYEYVDNLPEMMSQQDLLITKPGGLIVAESLALGLPMIILLPGPGQERANEEFLARHGAALNGESPERICEILTRCIAEPAYLQELKTASSALGFPNASETIACQILSELSV